MFTEKFREFEPFEVRALLESSEISHAERSGAFTGGIDKDKLPKFKVNKITHPDFTSKLGYSVSKDEAGEELKQAMEENFIGIAPAAHVVDLKKLADSNAKIAPSILATMKEYDYYNVELGLNISLASGYQISKLMFTVDLVGDGQSSEDVIARSGFPDNTVKKIKIIGGKVTLGVNSLLELIGGPIGAAISQILQVKLNPWEFDWVYEKAEVKYTGNLDFRLLWRLSHKNIWKGFNPTIILKKRKGVKAVNAEVKTVYELKKENGWAFWKKDVIDMESRKKEIKIIK